MSPRFHPNVSDSGSTRAPNKRYPRAVWPKARPMVDTAIIFTCEVRWYGINNWTLNVDKIRTQHSAWSMVAVYRPPVHHLNRVCRTSPLDVILKQFDGQCIKSPDCLAYLTSREPIRLNILCVYGRCLPTLRLADNDKNSPRKIACLNLANPVLRCGSVQCRNINALSICQSRECAGNVPCSNTSNDAPAIARR